MITFTLLHPKATHEMLGMIPGFFDEADRSSAREQLDQAYQHGGGWRPMRAWKYDPTSLELRYPGDPPIAPVAMGKLRDELILIYPHSWVCVVQPNGSFEVARMD